MAKRKSPPLTIKAVKAKGYSKAYEERLIRGIRKARRAGKKPTRQSARGHKPKEHVIRKEREKIRNAGLTTDQIRQIIRWYNDKFNPMGYREVPSEADLIDWTRENGYPAFSTYRKTWDQKRRAYQRERADETYESLGMGELYRLQGIARVDDYRWMYYH